MGAFLDRLAEHVIALGEGAGARVRAGRFESEAHTVRDLLETVDAARTSAQGREDLEIRMFGEPRDRLAKFLGTLRIELEFRAFVHPEPLHEARLCATCRRLCTTCELPQFVGDTQRTVDACPACQHSETEPRELNTCWWLRFFGHGPDGIGERFVEESRTLYGSRFFEALQGISRIPLYEWHTWG